MLHLTDWTCHQSWSNGRVALYGSSASAIAAYTLMRHHVPCLVTAVLEEGTSDLYRDVSYMGGIQSAAVSAGFLGLIASDWPAGSNVQGRLASDPASVPDMPAGLAEIAAAGTEHPQDDGPRDADAFWGPRDFAKPLVPHEVP